MVKGIKIVGLFIWAFVCLLIALILVFSTGLGFNRGFPLKCFIRHFGYNNPEYLEIILIPFFLDLTFFYLISIPITYITKRLVEYTVFKQNFF